MKSKTAIIIGAIILIIAAASAAAFLPVQSNNNTINSSNQQQSTPTAEPVHHIGIAVKTDGKTVTVKATSVSENVQVPAKMITEMKNKHMLISKVIQVLQAA